MEEFQSKYVNPPSKAIRKVGYDKFTKEAILTLVGTFTAMLILGIQFSWGNLTPYLVGYFRDMGVNTKFNDFYSILPIILISATVCFPIGSKFSYIYGCKKSIMLGGLIIIVSFLLSTFTSSPYFFVALISISFGLGKAFIFASCLKAASSHIPARNGFAFGVVVSALGVGSFIFGLVCTHIINPNNEHLT